MGYKMDLVTYKHRIKLPDNSYKGLSYTSEGWLVQDLKKGVSHGFFKRREEALLYAHSLGLNLLSDTAEVSEEEPVRHNGLTFEEYCAKFRNPKNKSGYKYVVDQMDSVGWVKLLDGRSHYNSYCDVESALDDAWRAGLNL